MGAASLPGSSLHCLALRTFRGPEPLCAGAGRVLGTQHSWSPWSGLGSWTTLAVSPDTMAWDGETEAPRNQVTGPRPRGHQAWNPEFPGNKSLLSVLRAAVQPRWQVLGSDPVPPPDMQIRVFLPPSRRQPPESSAPSPWQISPPDEN